MSLESTGLKALDYFPCRYGTSRLIFRGPRRSVEGDYIVYMGGIETFGKYMPAPYPLETEFQTGLKSINLGCAYVGVDSYLADRSLIDIAREAKCVVIEIVGAQNMSNRYYAVHPRRNDRFIRASRRMMDRFPNVDFSDVSFTRHLLQKLMVDDKNNFVDLAVELRQAWVSRMTELIEQIRRPIILVWLADHSADAPSLFDEPLFIDRRMMETLPNVVDIIEVVAEKSERAQGMEEMIYTEFEAKAAEQMLGPAVHRRVAKRLIEILPVLTNTGAPSV